MRSKPTEKAPLNSNLFFVADRNAKQCYWATKNHFINEGHLNLLGGAEKGNLPRHLPFSRLIKKSKLNADHMASRFIIDTLSDSRNTLLKVKNPQRAGKAFIIINEVANIDKIMIDGHLNNDFNEGATGFFYTSLYGIGLDSMNIEFVKRDVEKPVEAYINFSYSKPFMIEGLPEGVVRSDGFTYISELVDF